MADDGWTSAPERYTGQGRETIDRMRDLAHEVFDDPATADRAFAFYCLANAMKYEDRAGRKGRAMDDLQKAAWYLAMADHVQGTGEDPREQRPGFTPWERAPLAEGTVSDDVRAVAEWLRTAAGGAP